MGDDILVACSIYIGRSLIPVLCAYAFIKKLFSYYLGLGTILNALYKVTHLRRHVLVCVVSHLPSVLFSDFYMSSLHITRAHGLSCALCSGFCSGQIDISGCSML